MWYKSLPGQAKQYAAELALCLRLGATPRSRWRLAVDTCRFHLANRLPGRRRALPERRYPVRIGERRRDLWLRPNSGDFFILHEVFQGECYAIPAAWRHAAAATDVYMGANNGLASLYFSQHFPQARFVCVEPDPANAALLRGNLADIGERATVIEGAVSDLPGEACFSDDAWSWGGRIERGAPTSRRVRCYSMDEIIASAALDTIDLLKVDIEGEEQRLFADPSAWLRRVRLLVIELHPPYSIDQFRRAVEPCGFAVVPSDAALGSSMVFALNRAHYALPAASLQRAAQPNTL